MRNDTSILPVLSSAIFIFLVLYTSYNFASYSCS
jgi:hypothetical protein